MFPPTALATGRRDRQFNLRGLLPLPSGDYPLKTVKNGVLMLVARYPADIPVFPRRSRRTLRRRTTNPLQIPIHPHTRRIQNILPPQN